MTAFIAISILILQTFLIAARSASSPEAIIIVLFALTACISGLSYYFVRRTNTEYNRRLKERIEPEFDKIAKGKPVSIWD